VIFELKEPVLATNQEAFQKACRLLKRLTICLSGDPAPAHPAALLREVGSHNTKRGEPILVESIGGTGKPVDIGEVYDLCNDLPADGLFDRKDNGTHGGNGTHDHSNLPDDPFDMLESMTDGNRHISQLHASRGHSIGAAVDIVLDYTKKLGEPVNGRDWTSERQSIERMCYDWVNKHPEYSTCLPDGLREKFEAKRAEGYRAEVRLDRNRNWCVKGYGGPKPKALLELRPFTPIDEASLPPREWLYGRHYQRRTVSITAAPGGFGKSSLDMVEAIAMATGRNLLGEEPPVRLRVWLHNGDDSREEMDRRVVAI
jgi:hypothetical protein